MILYFNGPGTVDMEVIKGFIIDTPQATAMFLANKEWTRITHHEKGADIGVGKCSQTKPVANSKSTNKNGGNKEGGKKRGRGRGGGESK
jgi:hypothetical protein